MADTYRTDRSVESDVTAVDIGDGRHFVVIRYRIREWKTLVLQHTMKPDCWVSRREIHGCMDPIAAVTGYLLGVRWDHPIEELKKRLANCERDNWSLRVRLEKMTTQSPRKPKKEAERGRRAGRNT